MGSATHRAPAQWHTILSRPQTVSGRPVRGQLGRTLADGAAAAGRHLARRTPSRRHRRRTARLEADRHARVERTDTAPPLGSRLAHVQQGVGEGRAAQSPAARRLWAAVGGDFLHVGDARVAVLRAPTAGQRGGDSQTGPAIRQRTAYNTGRYSKPQIHTTVHVGIPRYYILQ